MINRCEHDIIQSWNSQYGNEIMVSIRCLAYNHEKYISQCLDGFLMQETTFPFEIIIHDDASTDHTADIIRQYEKAFPRIIKAIYETENQWSKKDGSLGRILNSKSSGKYFALCEGDDYWTDCHKLQLQYEALESNPNCSMCVCIVKTCEEDGTPMDIQYPSREMNLKDSGVISRAEAIKLLSQGYPFHTSSYFIKRDVYLIQPKGDYAYKRDLGNMLRAAAFGDYYYINRAMSVRRYGAKDGWTARHKAAGKKGAERTIIDDYLSFLTLDKDTDGLFRDLYYLSLCKKLCFISTCDRRKAVDLERRCIDQFGKTEYMELLHNAKKHLSFAERFIIETFSNAPILFDIGQNVFHSLQRIRSKL